jgi:hypothetical protein
VNESQIADSVISKNDIGSFCFVCVGQVFAQQTKKERSHSKEDCVKEKKGITQLLKPYSEIRNKN